MASLPWKGLFIITTFVLMACGLLVFIDKSYNAAWALGLYTLSTMVLCLGYILWEWATPKRPASPPKDGP